MDTTTGRGRVIVGVDDTPTGLRTLRAAVKQASMQHRELIAVRAFSLPPDPAPALPDQHAYRLGGADMQLKAAQTWQREVAARERQAARMIERAFQQAMAEVPDTVGVRCLAIAGSPGPALVDSAYKEDDLLVVGTSASRHWRRLFRRPVSRYCASHAACPILLVPPHELARQITRRHYHWRRHELENLLMEGSR
jgi:nucleotide-binding universal stress UspA family protein